MFVAENHTKNCIAMTKSRVGGIFEVSGRFFLWAITTGPKKTHEAKTQF